MPTICMSATCSPCTLLLVHIFMIMVCALPVSMAKSVGFCFYLSPALANALDGAVLSVSWNVSFRARDGIPIQSNRLHG